MSTPRILVIPQSKYLPDQSDPVSQKFVWAYIITIVNNSDEMVQLLRRSWLITDMASGYQKVEGPGVVGLQPVIKSKKSFTYTSLCRLITPHGTMEGKYEFWNLNEEHFEVAIPQFILTAPLSITKTYRTKLH